MLFRNLFNRNARQGKNGRSRDTRRAAFRREMTRGLKVESLEPRVVLSVPPFIDLLAASGDALDYAVRLAPPQGRI